MKETEYIYSDRISYIEQATKQVKASAVFTKRYIYIFPKTSVANFLVVNAKTKYPYSEEFMAKVLQLAKDLSIEDFHEFMTKIATDKRVIDVRYLIEFNVFSHWYAGGFGYREQTGTHKVVSIKPRAMGKRVKEFYHK